MIVICKCGFDKKITAVFLLVSASNSVPSPSMQQNIGVLCSSFHSRVLSHKQLFEVRQIVTFSVWAGMFGMASAALSSLIALHTHTGVHLEGAWGGGGGGGGGGAFMERPAYITWKVFRLQQISTCILPCIHLNLHVLLQGTVVHSFTTTYSCCKGCLLFLLHCRYCRER